MTASAVDDVAEIKPKRPEWHLPFALIAGFVLLVEVVMFGLDMGPETMMVAAVIGFTGICVWCYFSLVQSTAEPPEPARVVAASRLVGTDRRVRHLRTSILFGRSMGGYTERLHETLVDIIDDQLLHAHGVDRANDPEAAAAILHPRLQAMVSDPDSVADISKTDELARIVALIEAL